MRFSYLVLALLFVFPLSAEAGRYTLTEENDSLIPTDDWHYTQGLRLSYLTDDVTGDVWARPYHWFGPLPVFKIDGNIKRKYDWTIIGQNIYTPLNIATPTPLATDRPYGGWLYTGVSLLQDTEMQTHHRLENFEILLGVVGPASLAAETQRAWHSAWNVTTPRGWGSQLKNEPGLVISYERKWRFQHKLGNSGLAVDAIPEIGGTVGNVFTYAEGGGLLRFGQNLGADYGPSRIRPALSGTGWFDKDQMTSNLGWYFFAGVQGRAVARNIFLDGNSFTSSASVDKENFVGDLVAGASLFWTDAAKLDFMFVHRTKECTTQPGHPDRYAGINLSVGF
jgi:hypothetical protein